MCSSETNKKERTFSPPSLSPKLQCHVVFFACFSFKLLKLNVFTLFEKCQTSRHWRNCKSNIPDTIFSIIDEIFYRVASEFRLFHVKRSTLCRTTFTFPCSIYLDSEKGETIEKNFVICWDLKEWLLINVVILSRIILLLSKDKWNHFFLYAIENTKQPPLLIARLCVVNRVSSTYGILKFCCLF